VLARTAPDAIALLAAGGVTHLSLDHDLGGDAVAGTGYDVAAWIEEAVALRGFAPPEITIHSANVVGRQRMAAAVASIERLVAAGPRGQEKRGSSHPPDGEHHEPQKVSVQGLEEALAAVPAEDHGLIRAGVERAFADFDPENPPGEPVRAVEPGTRACPICGGTLVEFTSFRARGELVRILDCSKCEATFAEPGGSTQ